MRELPKQSSVLTSLIDISAHQSDLCRVIWCVAPLSTSQRSHRDEYKATPTLSLSETTSSMEAVVCTWELVALVLSLLEACPGFFFSFSSHFFLRQLGLMCPFF